MLCMLVVGIPPDLRIDAGQEEAGSSDAADRSADGAAWEGTVDRTRR